MATQSIKRELPYNPVISLLGIHPKETKTRTQTNTYMNVIAAIFPIARRWKPPKCPSTDE